MKTILAVLLLVAANAYAQRAVPPGQTTVPIALEVQRLAPQLVAFAGSLGNFENLVNGIALGVPVTLTTVGADGVVQTVTFVNPGGAVGDAAQIARVLETARQQLIAQGIAAPTGQQLAEQVSGTTVPVTISTLPVQPGAAAGGSSPAQQIQSRNTAVPPPVNTSDSRNLGNTSNTPTPPAPPQQGPAVTGSAPAPRR